MKALTMFSGVVLAAMAVACGESAESESTSRVSGSMTVHGTVSTRLSIDNARAVAIGSDGRTFWAYLDQDREFTLDLPVGQSYRVIVANQRANGGQQTIGHLMLSGGSGRTEWIGANKAINVDLGLLRLAGTTSSTGVKPSCACSDDDYDDAKGGKHDDDYPTKDSSGDKGSGSSKDTGSKGSADDGSKGSADDADEGDKGSGKGSADPDDCNVCTDKSTDKELEPSKKPSGCEDKDAEKHADKDDSDYGDKKPCSSDGSDSKGGSDSDADSDSKGSADTGGKDSDAPSKDGSSDSGKGSGSGDSSGGSKSAGSKCNASTECTSTCSCVASTCSTKK